MGEADESSSWGHGGAMWCPSALGQTPHIQQLLSEQVAQMNGIDTRQSRESLESLGSIYKT